MAGLLELAVFADELGLLLDIGSAHGRGKESNVDDLASFHVGDGAGLETTARETHVPFAVLEAEERLYYIIKREVQTMWIRKSK